jgi:hypothetical protein
MGQQPVYSAAVFCSVANLQGKLEAGATIAARTGNDPFGGQRRYQVGGGAELAAQCYGLLHFVGHPRAREAPRRDQGAGEVEVIG